MWAAPRRVLAARRHRAQLTAWADWASEARRAGDHAMACHALLRAAEHRAALAALARRGRR